MSSLCNELVSRRHGARLNRAAAKGKLSIGECVPQCSKFRSRKWRSAASSLALSDEQEKDFSPVVPSFGPDMFVLELAEKLQEQEKPQHLGPSKDMLDVFGEEASVVALNLKWPTSKEEAFRFTNIKWLRACELVPAAPISASNGGDVGTNVEFNVESLKMQDADGSRLVFVDGVLSKSLSSMDDIPTGIVVCGLDGISDHTYNEVVCPSLGKSLSRLESSDLFSSLNAIGTLDIGVIFVPRGVVCSKPVHIVNISTGSGNANVARVSNPRLLVVVEDEGEFQMVEEFVGTSTGYWTNSVTEIFLGKNAKLSHGYIQSQHRESFHTKRTYISQDESSAYSMVEAGLGARLSRHSLLMEQKGPETETEVSTFTLSGSSQLQDLHSSLILDHPRGETNQLHKCIVTHAKGFAVFDGNVKVNRYAQQTDAGQLSRSLLLAPKGTINVKPNLQIIADDVKCTHGAAISDLEDDQLFYFRARGIDEESARSALVFSFGAEVIEKLPYSDLKKRIEESVKQTLLEEGAMGSSVAAGLNS